MNHLFQRVKDATRQGAKKTLQVIVNNESGSSSAPQPPQSPQTNKSTLQLALDEEQQDSTTGSPAPVVMTYQLQTQLPPSLQHRMKLTVSTATSASKSGSSSSGSTTTSSSSSSSSSSEGGADDSRRNPSAVYAAAATHCGNGSCLLCGLKEQQISTPKFTTLHCVPILLVKANDRHQ